MPSLPVKPTLANTTEGSSGLLTSNVSTVLERPLAPVTTTTSTSAPDIAFSSTTTTRVPTTRVQQRVEQSTLDWLDVKYDVSKVHGKVLDLNRTIGGATNDLFNVTNKVVERLQGTWSTRDVLIMGFVTLIVGIFIGVALSTLSVSHIFIYTFYSHLFDL